jgi:hypothetical protein
MVGVGVSHTVGEDQIAEGLQVAKALPRAVGPKGCVAKSQATMLLSKIK